jgi:hypothetical protein
MNPLWIIAIGAGVMIALFLLWPLLATVGLPTAIPIAILALFVFWLSRRRDE